MASANKIEKQLARLAKSREALFLQLNKNNSAQLEFRPTPKSWNTLDVCWHLYNAESLSLQYMRKKAQYPDKLLPTAIGNKFRFFLLEFALRAPLKYKIPQSLDIPETDADFEGLGEKWAKLHEEIRVFSKKIALNDLNKLIYRHPRAGRINFSQGISFFQAHFDHHLKQLERIKKSPGYPKQ